MDPRARVPGFRPGRLISGFRAVYLGVIGIGSTLAGDPVDGISLPYRSVTISSPVQDILSEVYVEEGDPVIEGQALAQLLDQKERIEFRRYEKLLEKRQFDAQASRNLLEGNLLSREKVLSAEAELELAQVEYDLSKVVLEEKTIRSTVDGIVIRRHVDPGESVDRVQPLFEIVNVEKLTLQLYVEPAQILDLEAGEEIPFHISGSPDTAGIATVDFISPAADPQSGLFRVKLLVDNSEKKFLAGVRITANLP